MADPPKTPARGVLIDPVVIVTGGAVALVGLALVAIFFWMVPSGASRELVAACRALGGSTDPRDPLAWNEARAALCPHVNGQPSDRPCALPVKAPDFLAIDHTGKQVKLSDFRGKVVLLNFGASWCGVCKAEKPGLAEMAKELAGGDFVVLTLSSDVDYAQSLAGIIEALTKVRVPKDDAGNVQMKDAMAAYERALPKGVPFRLLLDKTEEYGSVGPIARRWGMKAVPESALIDRNGMVRAYFVNRRDWTMPVAQTCLRKVIEG